MVSDEHLALTKAVHRRTGKTFYYATRLLPERVRHPTYVLYAFFRAADEVVDAAETDPPTAQRRQLREFREAALGRRETDDPVLVAFEQVRQRYDIPEETVERFVGAMLADVAPTPYETPAAVGEYVDGSAAAVGEMMTYVMQPDDLEAALPYARRLGEAFQMTNFVRDVGEDARDLDRVYLPVETLAAHGTDPETVRSGEFSPAVAGAIQEELSRAERRYREGVAGIGLLPEDCQLPVLTAAVLYAEHHRLVRRRGFDTVTATPSLSAPRKLALLARTWWHWRRHRDPEATFAAVSAVPTAGRPAPTEPGATPSLR